MMENDLNLLELNLVKKSDLLDQLLGLSDKQLTLLESSTMTAEVFDAYMEELDEQIQKLRLLNEEVDELYERLCSEELLVNGPYVLQIGHLKELVAQIMEKTGSLQEKEQFNKQKLEVFFQNERKNLGSGRRSSKAALDYYKSMNRSNVVPPQFMDQKK